MSFRLGVFCAFLCFSVQADELFVSFDMQAISESVPIYDMLNHWQQDFQPGTVAYLNSEVRIRLKLFDQTFKLGYVQRLYYLLLFNQDTSKAYYNIEHNKKNLETFKLDLSIKSFLAKGITLEQSLPRVTFLQGVTSAGLILDIYQLHQAQFVSLSGDSLAQDSAFSDIDLHYYYSEDRLLDHQVDVSAGRGVSLSTRLQWSKAPFFVEFLFKDIFNRLLWDDIGYTQGCYRIEKKETLGCGSFDVASGYSDQRSLSQSISPSLWTQVAHDSGWFSQAFWHSRYTQLGVGHRFQQKKNPLSVSIYYPFQVGITWHYRSFVASMVADELAVKERRFMHLSLSWAINW